MNVQICALPEEKIFKATVLKHKLHFKMQIPKEKTLPLSSENELKFDVVMKTPWVRGFRMAPMLGTQGGTDARPVDSEPSFGIFYGSHFWSREGK